MSVHFFFIMALIFAQTSHRHNIKAVQAVTKSIEYPSYFVFTVSTMF